MKIFKPREVEEKQDHIKLNKGQFHYVYHLLKFTWVMKLGNMNWWVMLHAWGRIKLHTWR